MIILSAEIKCNLEKIVMGTTTHRHRFAMEIVNQSDTPFYYYDMDVLHAALDAISRLTAGFPYKIHYAVKANGNPHILNEIKRCGIGVDLVSGGEIMAALKAGFAPHDMNFSGVGKSDWEIRLGLEHEIGCFNVESVPELDIIDHLASLMDKRANIAIRVNPDIDPHTREVHVMGGKASLERSHDFAATHEINTNAKAVYLVENVRVAVSLDSIVNLVRKACR